LAVEFAENQGVPLSLGSVARRLYGEANGRKLGDRDSSVVITLLEEKVGVKVRI
jgi:3-hydroxyisobutyrate dehydrogenase-like beta-hydroxyacid dehydrogenase